MSENHPSVFRHPALEEKGLVEIRPALVKAYHDALAALKEDQFDSAIGQFHAILEQEPGFYECRQSLHAARLQRGPLASTFTSRLAQRARNLIWLARARLSLRSHPDRVLRTGERILDCDGTNIRVHKLMAKAALRARLARTAALSLEYIVEHAPEEGGLAAEYAAVLAELGDISPAIALCGRLLKDDPGNGRLTRLMKGLADYARSDQTARTPALAHGVGTASVSKASRCH